MLKCVLDVPTQRVGHATGRGERFIALYDPVQAQAFAL
jgi:hypothetical protein